MLLSLMIVPSLYAADAATTPSDSAPIAAEEVEPTPASLDAAEQETEFSYGTVKNVGPDQLVVSEYDYESNSDVEVSYKVSADTEFENVGSLKEVAVGDAVDIDFVLSGDDKVAVAITVEKPLSDDEEAALAPAEETPKE